MTDPQIPKQPVAVIGLGAMGMAMSRVLLKASWPLVGVDVRPEQLQEIATHGARTAQNPAEAASLAKLFLLMVVNDAQCEEVLFGEQGLLRAMTPGSVVINCATVPPLFARNTGSRLEKNSMHYLDAPVSGGTKGAWNGALSVMAAGSDQALEASQAVLQVLAKQIYHLGREIGQGSYMKMINQLLVGVHIVSAAEAMALAVRSGLDPETIYEIITNSAGNDPIRNYVFVSHTIPLKGRSRYGKEEIGIVQG